MSTANNAINNQIGTSTTATSLSHIRSASGVWQTFNDQTDLFGFYNRAGTPEGNIAANIGSICTDTTNGDLYVKTTDTVNTGWQLLASSASLSVVNQTFTVNGTYTPTSGMVYCKVEMLGGGGAGGGATATAGGQVSVGGGGGAGEYASGIFSAATIGASQAVTIGAAGAGASGAGGGAGGNSSLGAILSANGGAGGGASAAGNPVAVNGGLGGTGGAGGDFRTPGAPGDHAVCQVGLIENAKGGDGHYGAGGQGFVGAAANGTAALGYGSGGGGASANTASGPFTGGAGTAGLIVVTEWVLS